MSINNWQELFVKKLKLKKSKVKKVFKLNKVLDYESLIISIVGTNGKGSVSHYLNENLMLSKNKIGLFTSPHILNPNERIKVNGDQISDNDFFRIYNSLHKINNLNFFAILLLVAMKYFHEQNVGIIILEAGIGGKKDYTSIFANDIGILTSIGDDHAEYYNSDLEMMIKDKIGIATKNMNFYLPSFLNQNLFYIAKNRLKKIGANVIEINNNFSNYEQRNQNLACAILKKEFLIEECKFSNLLGRTTIIDFNGLKHIVDVGHNESAILASIQLLKQKHIFFSNIVISIQKKKNIKNIKNIFANKNVYFYSPSKEYHNLFNINFKQISNLKEYINKTTKNTLFIGSFFFAKELIEIMK